MWSARPEVECWLPCARASAIHARWLSPPESSSKGRSAKLLKPVSVSTDSTACVPSAPSRPNSPVRGKRPNSMSSRTVSPGGLDGDWGRTDTRRAIPRGPKLRMSRPSRSTTPLRVRSSRAIARITVDFPDPFGPTIAVIVPCYSPSSRPSSTILCPYPALTCASLRGSTSFIQCSSE